MKRFKPSIDKYQFVNAYSTLKGVNKMTGIGKYYKAMSAFGTRQSGEQSGGELGEESGEKLGEESGEESEEESGEKKLFLRRPRDEEMKKLGKEKEKLLKQLQTPLAEKKQPSQTKAKGQTRAAAAPVVQVGQPQAVAAQVEQPRVEKTKRGSSTSSLQEEPSQKRKAPPIPFEWTGGYTTDPNNASRRHTERHSLPVPSAGAGAGARESTNTLSVLDGTPHVELPEDVTRRLQTMFYPIHILQNTTEQDRSAVELTIYLQCLIYNTIRFGGLSNAILYIIHYCIKMTSETAPFVMKWALTLVQNYFDYSEELGRRYHVLIAPSVTLREEIVLNLRYIINQTIKHDPSCLQRRIPHLKNVLPAEVANVCRIKKLTEVLKPTTQSPVHNDDESTNK